MRAPSGSKIVTYKHVRWGIRKIIITPPFLIFQTGDEEKIKLEEPNAINDLGNTVDTVPSLSYNYDYYGDLHTTGHILIAYCHDPEKRFKVSQVTAFKSSRATLGFDCG